MKEYDTSKSSNTCDLCCVGQTTDASHVCEACKATIIVNEYVGD